MLKIGKYNISNKDKPFIIAEISANHKNNLHHLLKMIDAAAEAGVAAVIMQTILPNEINLNNVDDKILLIKINKDFQKNILIFTVRQQCHLSGIIKY